jgi:hypothetical protein
MAFKPQHFRPSQLLRQHLLDTREIRRCQGLPGDQRDIPTGLDEREIGLNRLPEQAFGSITLHRISYYTTSDNTDSQSFNLIRTNYDHHQGMGKSLSKPAYPLEICGPDETELAFHPCAPKPFLRA